VGFLAVIIAAGDWRVSSSKRPLCMVASASSNICVARHAGSPTWAACLLALHPIRLIVTNDRVWAINCRS